MTLLFLEYFQNKIFFLKIKFLEFEYGFKLLKK
jgi:hypothetical protein